MSKDDETIKIAVDDSVTVVMPALNEENNITPSINMVKRVFNEINIPYELIIVNDRSSDGTMRIAIEAAKYNKCIKVIHNYTSQGMGACYKKALEIAKYAYFILIVSKNECDTNSIINLINCRNKADIIIPYTTNTKERDAKRELSSKYYTNVLNLITGFNLKYYNGTVLHKTSILNSINIHSTGHAFQSEALIKLLEKKYTYLEIPIKVNWNKSHKTNAFRIFNIIELLLFLLKLISRRFVDNIIKFRHRSS